MKETTRNTTDKRIYKILNYDFDYYWDCYGCPRSNTQRQCKMNNCNGTRNVKRNWKEFRKKQYKL